MIVAFPQSVQLGVYLSYTMCKSNLDPMRIASRLLKVAFFAKFNEIYPERETEKCVSSIAGLLGLMLCEYLAFLMFGTMPSSCGI